MKNEHKYDIGELEDMIPFEREFYTSLLKDHLQREKARRGNG